MVACFLAFQDTNEFPIKMQKPVTDFLESGHDPQSKSEKALSCKPGEASEKAFKERESLEGKRSP